MSKHQFTDQKNLNHFTNSISNKIQNGFVIVERNDKYPFTVLVKEGIKVDHRLNFLVTCATLGIWLLPWLYLSQVSSKAKQILIAIDEEGNVFEQNCYRG
ncbi:hypothetical protein [Flavobacterium laiguense]|uniref:Uncharacterized protein n=1 Tax=Flavobacterium laiguense TaxID=2169409 RepID=A0A2U1JVS0_9FLAO|nr:hypothetical protein [Flavobacterium laiguense]PWA09310.1 hypothetical protein DB891_08455 [Flavobacterium laiguense]